VSNQQKAELVSGIFGIQSFRGGSGKISPRAHFLKKGMVCPEFPIQQPGQVLTFVTHKSLTITVYDIDLE
jgi:hypothetical protein